MERLFMDQDRLYERLANPSTWKSLVHRRTDGSQRAFLIQPELQQADESDSLFGFVATVQ
jgi:hypothetical protein